MPVPVKDCDAVKDSDDDDDDDDDDERNREDCGWPLSSGGPFGSTPLFRWGLLLRLLRLFDDDDDDDDDDLVITSGCSSTEVTDDADTDAGVRPRDEDRPLVVATAVRSPFLLPLAFPLPLPLAPASFIWSP